MCFRISFSVCLLAILLVTPPATAAQSCQEAIKQTAPAEVFILHQDGTATHKTTGLTWMRCSLGQQWSGSACNGEVSSVTWPEALTAARGHVFAGYDDWRLPNKNELESIVEEACHSPAINAGIFPATPSLFFWTSSPYSGQATGAWSVDFGYGVVTATVKTGKLPVRLVRGNP